MRGGAQGRGAGSIVERACRKKELCKHMRDHSYRGMKCGCRTLSNENRRNGGGRSRKREGGKHGARAGGMGDAQLVSE